MPLIIRHLKDKTVIDVEGVIGATWADLFSNDPQKKAVTKENMRNELNLLENVTSDMSVKNILVRINSPGGSFNHAISIHDYLKKSKASIFTEVYGMTASGGSILSQCASPGNRSISENALFLIHRAWSCACGCSLEFKDYAEHLQKLDDIQINLFTQTTGKKPAEIEQLMNESNGAGKFYSATVSRTNGFFDKIIKINAPAAAKGSEQNFADFDAAALHLPNLPDGYNVEALPELAADDEPGEPASRTIPALTDKQENINNNPNQGVKGMKPEETVKLKDLCGDAHAKFVLDSSLDPNATYVGSVESFAKQLQADNAAVSAKLVTAEASLSASQAEVAKLKNEAPAEPTGSVAADNLVLIPSKTPEKSASERWNAALKTKTDAGIDVSAAVSAVVKENPKLHREFLAEQNKKSEDGE